MSDQTTFDNFAELSEITARFAAARVADDLMRQNHLADLLFMGYTPPTRWQRFKRKLSNVGHRARDIWTILRGGDIHENCGW